MTGVVHKVSNKAMVMGVRRVNMRFSTTKKINPLGLDKYDTLLNRISCRRQPGKIHKENLVKNILLLDSYQRPIKMNVCSSFQKYSR